MAKRKRRFARFRGRGKRFRIRRPKTIPILPITGFGVGLMFGSNLGWGTPVEKIMAGNAPQAIQSLIANLTGIGVPFPGTGYSSGPLYCDIGRTINPFDIGAAPALKGLIWGSAASMVLRALGVNRKFREATKSIPIIKKFSL